MESETVIPLLALLWLIGSLLLMARTIRRARVLAEELSSRHPSIYEALGRPRPRFFGSGARIRFARFVGRREYEGLVDDPLAARFEAHRKSEARLVVAIVATGIILAILGLVGN